MYSSALFLSTFPLIWPEIFGHIFYQDNFKMCVFDMDNYLYVFVAALYVVTIPFCGCIFSYYKIFQLVHNSKKAIRDKTQKSQFQVYKSLVIVFCAYMVTQVPAGIIIIDKLKLMRMPVRLIQISVHCFELNALINPWILGLTNPDFKSGFKWLTGQKEIPTATNQTKKTDVAAKALS